MNTHGFTLVTRKDENTEYYMLVLKHEGEEQIIWVSDTKDTMIDHKLVEKIEYTIRGAFSLIGIQAIIQTTLYR